MSNPQPWSAAAAGRRLGHRVEFHSEIGSTNDRARELLADRDGEGVAVLADLQTAGRGRRGRTWVSPPGVNLMVSVGLLPRLAAADAWQLSAAAVIAACTASSAVTGRSLAIKWPNDVVTTDGLKVGGLLVETGADGERLSEAVIGIGLNVNWRRAEMPAEIAARSTSLAELTGSTVDRVALLRELLATLDAEVDAVEHGRSPVERYRHLSWLDGKPVRVDLGGGRTIEGTVRGIGDDGSLRLATAGGDVAVSHGEVAQVLTAAVAA